MTSANPSHLNLLVVDDHEFVRIGLRQVLERSGRVSAIHEAVDVRSALLTLRTESIDIALIDISLPGRSGLELVREIRARQLSAKAIMLSMHEESLYGKEALEAGACGYVLKHQAAQSVLAAIDAVSAGRPFWQHASQMARHDARGGRTIASSAGGTSFASLTPKERELLRLFGQGQSTAAIAATLGRSIKTVEAHRSSLKQKLGTANITEFLRLAVLLTSHLEPRTRPPLRRSGVTESGQTLETGNAKAAILD
jgi:DNA-binding NarL/FixJ family response regulator